MPFGLQKADVKKCDKTFPPHPCDPPVPCNPDFLQDDCPEPFICTEKIKHPAIPGEISKVDCETSCCDDPCCVPCDRGITCECPDDPSSTCKPGPFMFARTCNPPPPPHPCDPKPPCSTIPVHLRPPKKRLPCVGGREPLCYEKIKNPENRPKEDPSCEEGK